MDGKRRMVGLAYPPSLLPDGAGLSQENEPREACVRRQSPPGCDDARGARDTFRSLYDRW